MKRRRVKITGIGPVTPAGIGREEFWKGILEPVSRVRPYPKFEQEHGPFVAAFIDKFNISDYIDRALVPKGMARHTLFAVVGAILAMKDAGLTREELLEASCVIVTGSSIMDFGGISASIEAVQKRGSRAAQQRVLFTTGIGSIPSTLNNILGLEARSLAISTQCNSGLDAIGHAADMVATGEADIAICGGTEAPLHRFPLLELRAAGLTPSTTEMPGRIARPFDLWRTTGVVSEGASMFVIEPETSPRRGYRR
jgi:3-oxoacyl-[acyl-carrier-protein] synthase II